MLRFSAIFIAVCMVLIAASLGAALFLVAGLDGGTAVLAALGLLGLMIVCNTLGNWLRERSYRAGQMTDLARGTAELAQQVGDFSRRLAALESKAANPALAIRDRLPVEIGELGGLVRQLAEMVALHEAALQEQGLLPVAGPADADHAAASAPEPRGLRGLAHSEAAALIARAMDEDRIDLYLQPIVTLPQRKVRCYEAVARLRTEEGEVIPAEEFIADAERGGLVPRLDNLMLFRCVQVTRRLQLKNRDVGVVCNIGAATLADPVEFKKLLDFAEANRALASSLTFEFRQSAYRAFGPLEREGLAALAELGYRFSMDHVADLRLSPQELVDGCFCFLKVPAALLLDKSLVTEADIHPEDFASLLARSGVNLIAERIESEATVAEVLDYGVRFGQGLLFSGPRPVRAEALQAVSANPARSAPEVPAALAAAR